MLLDIRLKYVIQKRDRERGTVQLVYKGSRRYGWHNEDIEAV